MKLNLNFLKANEAIEAKEATRTRGFTLIELLVVIAIIGILSGIVLTSLGTARNKAKDASAKASLASMRAQAELAANSSTGQYPDLICTAANSPNTPTLTDLVAAVDTQIPTANAPVCVQDSASGSPSAGWAALAALNDATIFCVDSRGFSGTVASTTVIATTRAAGADVTCN